MRKSPLVRISLRNALVAGVLVVIFLIVLFYAGRHPFLILPFFDFRILLFGIFIFFTLKEYRDYHQQGILYFWQALFGSVVVVVVSSWIAALGLWIFGTLEPKFVSSYIELMISRLKTFPPEEVARVGKETFERNLEQLPATNILTLVLTHFAQGLLIGSLISVVLSVALRKTNQTN